MPALFVSVDGQHVATVAADDNTMISLHVYGNRSHEQFAVLDMHGGRYGEGQSQCHLIWIDEWQLKPGQVVVVACVADAPTSDKGKTIDELYPDEPQAGKVDFTMTDSTFDALSARPLLRDGYAFTLAPSAGTEVSGRTEGDEVSFAMRVMWTAQHRPDSARYSLGTTTLANVRARSPARSHALGWLEIGDSLRFEVSALASA